MLEKYSQDIKELFRDVASVKQDLAALRAVSEVQLVELKDIRASLEDFKHGCNFKHQGLQDDITSIKTKQAHANGLAQAKGDLTSVAYMKLGAIFTAIYAILFALQWLSGGPK